MTGEEQERIEQFRATMAEQQSDDSDLSKYFAKLFPPPPMEIQIRDLYQRMLNISKSKHDSKQPKKHLRMLHEMQTFYSIHGDQVD